MTIALVACLPSVYLPLLQFFHPEDLLATGLALVGVAFVLRDRWLVAGFVLGLAVLSQQFTLLFLIPLLVVAPRTRLLRFVGGTACSIAIIGVPLLAITSGRALTAIVVGTGDSEVPASRSTAFLARFVRIGDPSSDPHRFVRHHRVVGTPSTR